MGVILNLSGIALRQLVGGALQAVGVESGGEAVVRFLLNRFTDHSQALAKALKESNERAWKAMEVALGGESLWDRCKLALARAEDQAFREQVRAFLDASPLTKASAQHANTFRLALSELRATRSRGLLTAGQLSPDELARQAGAFARFDDPQALVDAEWKVVNQVATDLRETCPNLGKILAARSSKASSQSILAVAVRYYFRRQVETNEELFQGLAFAKLEAIQETQEKAFSALSAALSQQGQRLEGVLGEVFGLVVDVDRTTKDTNARVRGLEDQVRKLLEQLQLQDREVRPSDSLSVRGEAEQQKVQKLVAEYRELPQEEREQRPALLGDVAKLEVAAGEFEAAQRDFEKAAALATDPRAQAEAHHNAYRAALERQQWAEALAALRQAVALDPERFAPFSWGKYVPQRILGAGGFGVVFLCQQPPFSKPVVIKSLLAVELDRDVKDVFAEATALEELEHPGIVKVKDCGYADPAATRPYFVMEYFDGANLGDHVAAHGRLSPADLLAVARPVAEALQAAHQRGIMHRDVKPANVLVRDEPSGWKVKLIDFGLALRPASLGAKASTQGHQARTTLGRSIAGTIHYAAPEQMGRDPDVPVGPYSDVYGFGRTCYYALFRTPDPDDDEKATLPEGFRQLLSACTRRQGSKRPADFASVLAELARLSVSPQPVPVPVGVSPVEVVVTGAGSETNAGGETDLPPVTPGDQDSEEPEDSDETPAGDDLTVVTETPLAAGVGCLQRGEYAQAARLLTQALKGAADAPEVYRQRARAYLGRGNLDKALADLDRVVKLEPKVPANLVERGRTFATSGSHDRAISDFTQALLCGGRSAELFVHRARSYAAKGNWDLAYPDFDQALQLAPAEAETYYHRGEVRLRQDALDQALADFTEAARLRPDDARFINAQGRVFLRQGKADDALAEFIRAAHRDPNCAETYLLRARVFLDRDRNEEAIADLNLALDFDARCIDALEARGLARYRLGRLGQALSDYNKAIKLRPRDPALLVGRGDVLLERQEYQEATQDFQAAINLDKTSAAAYLGRATARFWTDAYGGAISDYSRVLELKPGDVDALSGRSWAYLYRRQNDEAIADATEVIRLDPNSADAHHVRGCAHRNKKAFEQALADLTESVRLEPDEDRYFERGLAYYQSGDYERAVADYTSAIKLDGKNAEYYRHRARAFDKKGERAKAREDRERANALSPDDKGGSGEPDQDA